MSAAEAPTMQRTASGRKQSMPTCIVCCHAIDNATRYHTVGACGHVGCCSVCAARMRQLLGNTACPICKADLPRVICVESDAVRFDSFQDWGDNIGPTHVFDEAAAMFFLKEDYPNVCKLRDTFCRKCNKKFSSLNALKTHLLDMHHLQYCGICLEHKKVFLDEHELFTKEQLKQHSAKGNPKEGFTGHPRCDFCFTRYYSTAELYEHLHKNHFECDICVRSLHIQNRYYKDYHDMENHFRAEHFLCEEPSCLAKKFVVFKSHIDFQAHMTKEHPHVKTSRKIDVHFTVRRAARDAAANDGFEDASQFQNLPSADDDHTINVADFPSLSGGSGRSGQLTFWENQTTTVPRSEDFPALAPAAGSRNGARAGPNFRNALAPPPTPAMLAHMHNSNGLDYPELATAAAALGANNPLMRFVKPSKMKRKKGKGGSGGGSAAATPSASPTHANTDDLEEKAEAVEDTATSSESKSALVLKIRQALGSDAKYEVFRETCKDYRVGDADVATFYGKVHGMFRPDDFEKLFVPLMRLFPDSNQVNEFMAFHRQRSGQNDGFKSKAKANKKQQQQQPQQHSKKHAKPPSLAASGWANALRESGVSSSISRGPAVVINNKNTKAAKAADLNRTTWSSTHDWQTPASVAAPAVGLTPVSSKIQTVAPAEAMGQLHIDPPAPFINPTPRPQPSQPASIRNRNDFPDLPKASKPIGLQSVTRATWDDQLQQIAQNRAQNASQGGKRKQKKKAMTLGEMAMKFA